MCVYIYLTTQLHYDRLYSLVLFDYWIVFIEALSFEQHIKWLVCAGGAAVFQCTVSLIFIRFCNLFCWYSCNL